MSSFDVARRWRGLIKTTAATALSRSRTAALMRSLNGWRHTPLVLGYHRVVQDFVRETRHSIPPMLISTDMLEKHLDWVGRHYQFVSLGDACARMQASEPFSRPTALVTFDDGYEDVYRNAFPLLKRKGIPAAVFAVTQLLDTDRLQIHDQLYLLICEAKSNWKNPAEEFTAILSSLDIPGAAALDKQSLFSQDPFALTGKLLDMFRHQDIQRIVEAIELGGPRTRTGTEGLHPLTWQMLDEMRRAGFTIGSHTDTHALLTNESMPDVLRELQTSRLALESRLGCPVICFAYPDGRFDSEVVRAVSLCGYTFGFSTCIHQDPQHPLLTIPRKVLWEKSCVDRLGRFDPAVMDCQITRLFDFMAPCTQNHRLPAASPGLRKVQAHATFERS